MAREDTRVALENIQKRLHILEMSDSMRKIAAVRVIRDNHIDVGDGEGHGYVYVLPVLCDKSGGIIYRTNFSEHANCGLPSSSAGDRGNNKDRKDLEIKLLKSELQRKDLELERQYSELRKIRYLESEEETSAAVSDKFVDKVDTIKGAASVAQQPSHYDDPLLSSNKSTSFSAVALVGNVVNSSIGHDCPESSAHKSLQRNLMVPAEQWEGKQDNGKQVSLVPDFERTSLPSECSDFVFKFQETISACLSSMQLSFRHLRSSIKLHDVQGNDSSNIDNGAVEDELFILEKIIIRLKELCEELGVSQIFIPNNMNSQKAVVKIIDGMIQKLIQDGSRIRALENLCITKDKRIEDLENQIQSIFKDAMAALIGKNELTSVVVEMNKVADGQRKLMEDILNFNGELLERLQVNEEKAESLSRRAEDAEEENNRLLKRLEGMQRTLKAEKQDNESLRSENEILKLKVSLAEYQLAQQDAALERLTSNLQSLKQCSLDEVECGNAQHQLKTMKKRKEKAQLMETEALMAARHKPYACKIEDSASAQCRRKSSENQLNQARNFLDELEENLHSMRKEVSNAFKGMPKIMDAF